MSDTRLWTKDFTILTAGSAVSMVGNSVSAFAISLLMLEKTGSVFLYVLYLVAYNIPKIILPMFAGSYLDRRSRRKTVYSLDFISAAVFLIMFFIIGSGYFSYSLFLFICVLIGCIDSIYAVAYDSLFPMLISQGNFSKAYSISSLIYSLAYMLTPLAALIYKLVGAAPLFLFNTVSFLIAAVCETQIKVQESQLSTDSRVPSVSFVSTLKSGFRYIAGEKGLLIITVYFFINSLCGFGIDCLWLPYFKSAPGLGLLPYSYVTAANLFGSLVGGFVHYKLKYPANRKFTIAMSVYIAVSIMDGGVLYMPFLLMLFVFFSDGFLSVTSYNIRLSATQSYIPEEYRGRFNGVFQTVVNAGMIAGQLLGGALGEVLPLRPLIAGFMAVNIIGAFAVMYRGRSHVKQIFNRDV